jgi:Holliday junction resolvase RusA-like endonuclease
MNDYPVIVTLPLPDPGLSPNGRSVWQKKARLLKRARSDGYLATVKARIDCQHRRAFIKCEAHPTFYVRDKRRRDGDNAQAMLKPYYDGMVDAGLLWDDKDMVHMPVKFEIDKANPRVEILVRPL